MHTPHMPHIMIFPGVDIFIFELEWSWLKFVVTWLKIFKPSDSRKKLGQMVLSQVTGNHRQMVTWLYTIWLKVTWLNDISHLA